MYMVGKFKWAILVVCMVGLIFTGCRGSLPTGGLVPPGSSLPTGNSGGGDNRVDREYQIKVSGTTGLKFSGSFTTITAVSGPYYPRVAGIPDGYEKIVATFEGIVPAEYSAKGISISVNIKKEADSGTLKVEIFEAGTPATTVTEITAPYGMANIGR
jgi:hypothetical protein